MNRTGAPASLCLGLAVAFACAGSSAAGPGSSPLQPAGCIAPLSYLALDPALAGSDVSGRAVLGNYERISPDGRFVLRSWSGARLGEVSLIELPGAGGEPVRIHRTPLSNEAFPVQGSWRYLVDVNGDHYRFADVLREQGRARPLFRGGMTGFYAAAAELSATAAQAGGVEVTLRSLSWPQAPGVPAGGAQGQVDTAGTGPLQIRTLRVRDDGRTVTVLQDSGPRHICTGRAATDGNVYALPMLSVDGREFSAVPQAPNDGPPSMRVYGLADEPFADRQPCDLRLDLGFAPAKAVFGFPEAGSGPKAGHGAALTYTDNASVYFFERGIDGGSGRAFAIDDQRTEVLASAFPGLTRDGRVIFGATWKDCARGRCTARAGYVVADPYQSSAYLDYWSARGKAPPHACITQSEVEHERAAFAAQHDAPSQPNR